MRHTESVKKLLMHDTLVVLDDVWRAAPRAPGWTADPFSCDIWHAVDKNPSKAASDFISFVAIPMPFRIACKELLCALDQTSEAGRRRVKSSGGGRAIVMCLKHLTLRLESLGRTGFSTATKEEVNAAYLDYSGLLSGIPKCGKSGSRYLATLSHLYRLGPSGSGSVRDGLMFDPSKDALNVGRNRSLQSSKSTHVLPEETVRKLLNEAADWVETKAPHIIALIKANELIREELAMKDAGLDFAGESTAQKRARLAKDPVLIKIVADAQLAFGGPLTALLPSRGVRKGDHELTTIDADCRALGHIVRRLQGMLQAFCYSICAGFNGWRVSEILAIGPQSLTESPAGFSIATPVRKTAINASQNVTRPVPKIVADAVRVLAEMNNTPAWGSKRAANRASNSSVFASASGGLLGAQRINDSLTDAWKMTSGDDLSIKSHQFRRFFAYFFLRRHQGNLDAVRRHFRHVSPDMVWAYAKDAMNARYLVEEKGDLARTIASAVISGEGYKSTGVAQELASVKTTLKLGAKILSIEDASSYIEKQVQRKFVEIHAMEWGYCLFQPGDAGAACEAKTGPVEERAEPSTCGRCKFLCTGKENVEFWQHASLLHQEVIEHPLTTKLLAAESERFLATATNILKKHAGEDGTSTKEAS